MTCAHCHRELASYCEITQYTKGGTPRGSVRVCGLLCLVQWGYQATVDKGVQLTGAAKNAFERLIEALRGV